MQSSTKILTKEPSNTWRCHIPRPLVKLVRNVKAVLLLGCSCLQAALNHSVTIGCHNKTLTKVTDNHWKIPVSPTYDCMTVVNTYHNFHVRTYKAQLVGAANIIEQHLTNTSCSATIDTTFNMDSYIPQENPNHIIV